MAPIQFDEIDDRGGNRLDKATCEKLNELAACNEGIAMASSVLLAISRDKVERARLENEYNQYQFEIQSKIDYAKRQGLQEGRKQEVLEIARKMKSRGISAEEIAGDTGLTLKQIEDL
jgi:predicted transposase/invertase (TIGR01784 family)